jgi:hypothetical protein
LIQGLYAWARLRSPCFDLQACLVSLDAMKLQLSNHTWASDWGALRSGLCPKTRSVFCMPPCASQQPPTHRPPTAARRSTARDLASPSRRSGLKPRSVVLNLPPSAVMAASVPALSVAIVGASLGGLSAGCVLHNLGMSPRLNPSSPNLLEGRWSPYTGAHSALSLLFQV